MKNLIWFQKLKTEDTVKFINHTANILQAGFDMNKSGSLQEWFEKEQDLENVCDKCGCESIMSSVYPLGVICRCPHCGNIFVKNEK